MKRIFYIAFFGLTAFVAIFTVTGCEACRPFAHVDRDGYSVGATGTWSAVATQVKGLIDPDGKTIAPYAE